jgi:hypothetical protein
MSVVCRVLRLPPDMSVYWRVYQSGKEARVSVVVKTLRYKPEGPRFQDPSSFLIKAE